MPFTLSVKYMPEKRDLGEKEIEYFEGLKVQLGYFAYNEILRLWLKLF